MKSGLYGFLLAMWVLILFGGGILVTILGPFSISGFGPSDMLIASIIKAMVAIILVVVWILILSKLKNWIFQKEINS